MGADQSNTNTPKESNVNKNKIENKPIYLEEYQEVNNNILKLSAELYKKYYDRMNDENLCKRLELIAVDKMDEINIFDLEKIVKDT